MSTQSKDPGGIIQDVYDPETSTLAVSNLNSVVPVAYDSIYPSYPNSVTEIYVYKRHAQTVATVTVIYTDSSKNELVSIVRT